jgi:hypothetical protein
MEKLFGKKEENLAERQLRLRNWEKLPIAPEYSFGVRLREQELEEVRRR